ncbi:MAG: hypothetical protein FJ278_04070, partial [Planctomycetes bacterium]|nr:hypothetical protein [Planctomycetota bacterium]
MKSLTIVLTAIVLWPWHTARAQTSDLAGYKLVEPSEPLPDKPWHDHFVDESLKTPEGQPNAGAAWCDFFLERACANQLQRTAAQAPWEQWRGFFTCAVWGYLSPDSKFRRDERLLQMSQVWLDTLFKTLATKPDDPKAAEKWQPNQLDTWSFHDYTVPLLEAEKRPWLKEKLGAGRIAKLREIVLANVRANTTPEAFNDLMGRAENYINIITHPMAVCVHGWLLTGERKYLLMAHRIVAALGRDQLPNGMFPYRYRLYGDKHCEYEAMYYHAINLRGLYLYWWATGSRQAEAIFRKSAPYYPLNLEPPHFFNDGPDIWWKDQWRTFWPHHIAMVAAVTGDGENAAIANAMARSNVSHDRFDLVLGAHAYQQMGLKRVAERPVRTDYVVVDPDIRGVRLRFGRWSATFTAGSFTYTRASAMRVRDDLKDFTALHLARPYVRVEPLEKPFRIEPDYSTLGREGAEFSVAKLAQAAAVATAYSPALTPATWQDEQPLAPWTMTELWLLTDRGMVGLLASVATADHQARELCHQFRFIIPGNADGQSAGEGLYTCGDLRFRVWATDFPFAVQERMRRYCQSERDRRDWQLCLSDANRSPEHLAQDPPPPNQPKPTLLLPPTRDYPKGSRRHSLVEVSPTSTPGFEAVALALQGRVLALTARHADRHYLAIHHEGDTEERYAVTGAFKIESVSASWTQQPTLPTPSDGKLVFTIPPDGTALV